MEIISIIISLITGLALGYIVFYFINKTKNVSRSVYENLINKNNETTTSLKVNEDRLINIQIENEKLFSKIESKENEISLLQSKSASLETVVKNYAERNDELNNISTNQIDINNNQQNEINVLKQKVAEINAVNNSLQEKLSTQKNEIIEIQKSSHFQFEKIANQIFEEKSGRFTETNKINIEALLKPLGENINTFKKKVEETYDKEAQQRFSLEQKVKELIEQTNKVSAEANNLATALKGQAKKQGNWGEVILESILQKSGLVKDREYFLQKNMKDEDGKNLRPDVLINLPDNRSIIIDSKVSLIAYDRFSSSEKSEEQTLHLSDHIKSIQNHINDLHGKKYDNLETSLDFTMMFIPIEPAYLLAIQADQELWSYAYSKRILLISPTNLIACLKLIADLWKREMQSKNAMEIVKRGELLYEKFVSFTEFIEDIGKHIDRSQTSYNNAINQLKSGNGNLVSQALKLKGLGLKSGKEIPPAMLPLDFDADEMKEIKKPE